MTTKYQESRYPGEHIVSDASGSRSVEQVTLNAGENLVAGTVVGVITATGNYKAFHQDAADGSEVAAGILFAGVDATDADAACVVHVRDCEVHGDALTFPEDIEQNETLVAIGQLQDLGIIIR